MNRAIQNRPELFLFFKGLSKVIWMLWTNLLNLRTILSILFMSIEYQNGSVEEGGSPLLSHVYFNSPEYPICFSQLHLRYWVISLLLEINWLQLDSGKILEPRWRNVDYKYKNSKFIQWQSIHYKGQIWM